MDKIKIKVMEQRLLANPPVGPLQPVQQITPVRQLLVTNMQIYQFANKAVPAPEDLFLLSDEANPGHITKNTTVGQLTAVVQTLITAKDNIRYVSSQGSDVDGTGTEGNPWATLSFALTQITDATTTNPYKLVFSPGVYTETDWAIKPNITYDFQNAAFTVTNAVTLDISWTSVSGVVTFQNVGSLSLNGGMNLNFAVLNVPFAVLNFDNLIVSASSLWTILGNPAGATITIIERVLGFASEASLDISDCYGGGGDGALQDVTIRNTDVTGHVFTFTSLQVLGNYYSEATGAGDLINALVGVRVQGNTTFKTTSAGQNNAYSIACRFFNAPTLDGLLPFWNPDLITALPTLLNGATLATNLVLSTLSNGMLANHSAVNYTPEDPSVEGHLAGIDTELGAIVTSITLETAYDGFNRILVETGRPVGFDTETGALQDAVINEGGNVSGGSDDINGFVFTSDVDGMISYLEYYAPNFTLPGTRQVGILNYDTQEILAIATISTSDPQVGQFYRKAVTPFRIVAGQAYICEALVPAGENLTAGSVTPGMDINVHLTLSQVVYEPSQTGIVYPGQFYPVTNSPTGNGSFAFTPISAVAEIDEEKANFYTGFKGFNKQQVIVGDIDVTDTHVGMINVGNDADFSSLALTVNSTIKDDASFFMLYKPSSFFTFMLNVPVGITFNGVAGAVSIDLNADYPIFFVQRVAQNEYVGVRIGATGAAFFNVANNFSEIANTPEPARGNLGFGSGILTLDVDQDYVLSNPAARVLYINIPTTPNHTIDLWPIQTAGGLLNGEPVQVVVAPTSQPVILRDSFGQNILILNPGDRGIAEPVGYTLSPVTGWYFVQASSGGSQDMQATYNFGSTIALKSTQPIIVQAGQSSVIAGGQNLTTLYSPSLAPTPASSLVIGMAFTPNQDGVISALGYADTVFSSGTREVGLWLYLTPTTGTLLATVNVAKTDPLDTQTGKWRMAAITPVVVSNGVRYVLAELNPISDQWLYYTTNPPPWCIVDANSQNNFASSTLVYPPMQNVLTTGPQWGNANCQFEPSTGYTDTVTIGDRDSSIALINVESTTRGTQPFGFGSQAQRDAIALAYLSDGLMWNNFTTKTIDRYNGTTSLWVPQSMNQVNLVTNLFSLVANTEYQCQSGGLTSLSLPLSDCPTGTKIRIIGAATGGTFKITQGAGQQIFYNSVSTTPGVTGSISSTLQFQSLELVSVAGDLAFVVTSSTGAFITT